MNTKKVVACLQALGFNPSEKSFDDRLKLQKIIYLLTLKGIDTGFAYGLYVRGPYSPSLAHDFLGNPEEYSAKPAEDTLTKRDHKIIDEFKETFELRPGILEAAATYAYYVKEEKMNAWDATKAVKKLKPFLSEAQVAVGTNNAKRFLFPPSKQAIKEMLEEFAPLEQAAAEDLVKHLDEKR